jgi:hypothetical protein
MTPNAAYFDRLAKMTPTTMNATKIHGHAEPGAAFFGEGLVMVYPLLSIDWMANE